MVAGVAGVAGLIDLSCKYVWIIGLGVLKMARTARIKAIDGGGWYLVSGVVTDQKSESPLAEAGCAQKLQWMLERYAGLSYAEWRVFA